MNYAEEVVNLRRKIMEAVASDVLDPQFKDFYEATLLQIMNETERQRQNCVSRADDLRRQASVLDGQSQSFQQLGSIIYAILNGYIKAAERGKAEEIARELERQKEAEEAAAEELNAAQAEEVADSTNKKGRKKAK